MGGKLSRINRLNLLYDLLPALSEEPLVGVSLCLGVALRDLSVVGLRIFAEGVPGIRNDLVVHDDVEALTEATTCLKDNSNGYSTDEVNINERLDPNVKTVVDDRMILLLTNVFNETSLIGVLASLDDSVQVFDELLCLLGSNLRLIQFRAPFKMLGHFKIQLDAGMALKKGTNAFKSLLCSVVIPVVRT